MLRQLQISPACVIAAMAMTFTVSAEAAASRTFVATTGSDSNVSSNCGATSPCRTFGAALSVTNSAGELVVLTSGGYGPASITQPVVITAIGIDASISVTTPGNGLTINTSGNVTLNGLNLHGEGMGGTGISVTGVGFLRLYNMLVENFTNDGINFNVDGKMAIYNSTIDSNGTQGLQVQQGFAYVSGADFDNNAGHAVEVDGSAQAVVVDSSASMNFTAFYAAFGGTLTLANDRAIFNSFAMVTAGGGAGSIVFANCLIAGNTTAYNVGTSTTIAGSNPGTSLIAAGQTRTGTLSTAVALE